MLDQAGFTPEGPHWSHICHGFPCPRRLDKDGDGIVTKQEAQEGLREQTDIPPEMLQRRLGGSRVDSWLSISTAQWKAADSADSEFPEIISRYSLAFALPGPIVLTFCCTPLVDSELQGWWES